MRSFQSHAGSIEAFKRADEADLERYDGFNPTLVRLRPVWVIPRGAVFPEVSIPRWFD